MFKKNVDKKTDNVESENITKSDEMVSAVKKEFFNIGNWKYANRKVDLQIEDKKMIIESKKKKVAYLSLFENNSNFNKSPKHTKTLNLTKDSLVRVTGNYSKDVTVTVYLIEYDTAGKKIKTNRVFINKEAYINIHPKTRSIRIAIRIYGKGEVTITNFRIIQDFITSQNTLKDNKLNLRPIKDIKMACIFDEFSMESFADEVTLLTFSPENWKKVLSQNKPDLLMVESAWRGNFGTWEFQIGKYNNNQANRSLKELIHWCKKNRIPTVFWNKEDPIHFEKFIGAASLFDYVLTTDADMIYKYKEIVKHNKVYSMQFAANPKEHNPTMIDKKKINKISFAGSYYANRHPDRRKDMDEMLRISKEFGLDIYDRNFERNKAGVSHFRFPGYLQENIVGTLKYNQINQAYKNYKLILNVNSVKQSPTMFSRRVFEGLACGTPIVSSYSTGIKKTFNDIVAISENTTDLKNQINELMSNTKTYRNVAMKGIREVFKHHTYKHRMKFILDKLQIKYRDEENELLSVICSVKSMDEFHKAIALIKEQSLKNVKIIMLIPLFEGYETLLNNYNNDKVSTYIREYAFKYDSVNDFITTKYVTVLNLNNEYDIHYLEDLIHATVYSGADIVGKKSLFDGENYDYAQYEYQFVENVIKDTAIYKIDKLRSITIKELLNDTSIIEKLFIGSGARVYSDNQFGIRLNTID